MIIVIVKKELLGAMFAIVVTDHQVHWLATALFERFESFIRHLNKCLVTKISNPKNIQITSDSSRFPGRNASIFPGLEIDFLDMSKYPLVFSCL